jgi:hypothetical protein
MHIVLTKQIADELRQKYTVLELDSMPYQTEIVPAYCVLPVECIAMEMSSLDTNIDLHGQLVEAIQNEDCDSAADLCKKLLGKFGGEVDSFYQVILDRIHSTGSTKLVLPT